MTSIGYKAFGDCALSTVISLIENPLYLYTHDNAFYGSYGGTLYVPIGTKEKYKAATGWKEFAFIEEGLPSGINNITKENNKNHDIYNLQGKKLHSNATDLNGLLRGVYIVNGRKVMVK